ncbi:MAG: GtrA family protein, partial [Chloroflexota bacterium]|nr:GtrA family protein [Chloroflexota bacterium]
MATRALRAQPHLKLAARFGLVGLSGILVNQAVLAVTTEWLGLHYLLSAILATQISTTWNFVGTERWAFAGRPLARSLAFRYAAFLAVSNAALLLRVPLLWALTDLAQVHYLASNLITLLVLFVLRYAFSDAWIWRAESPAAERVERLQPSVDGASNGASRAPARVPEPLAVGPGRPARYRYDVAGIVRLDSDVELPELAFFRTEAQGHPDIRIRIARVGAMPSRSTRFEENGSQLRYLEHLGAFGANFTLTMGDPIEIRVAPLLAVSRHVLYTNIVEAFLRFVMVSKGHVLLHSACIAMDGKAALLSAQTDTGKTSTVIRLVRDRGYQFLSDDMTIISPDGRARCYPKPMTLSYHTMYSIKGESLTRRQRAALAIQSRIHSKSGRTVGRALGRMNIPIMSVNSAVQIVVPPPKYRIDSLMPCEIGEEAEIGHVFLMERGEPVREKLSVDQAIGQLIENTDDAYGFPPFSTFAPRIRIGDDDYESLRKKELELLERALAAATVWRLRVPGHEWAELLPSLIEGGNGHVPELPTAEPASPPAPHGASVGVPVMAVELATILLGTESLS